MNAKDKGGKIPLHCALLAKSERTLRLLLAVGAEQDIFTAAALGDLPLVRKLVDKEAGLVGQLVSGQTPLHLAAARGHRELVEFLIDHGAEVGGRPYSHPRTPLHCAAEQGHKDVVELLVARGADVNAGRGQWIGTALAPTPLHRAARQGHKEVVEILLQAGADVHAAAGDPGLGVWTPLRMAKEYNHTEVAELLRQHGATR